MSKLGLFVNYFDNNTGLDHVSGKKIFYSMILVFFFVLFYQRMFLNEVKNKTLIYAQNMSFIGLFLYGTFLQFGEHVARISYYFTPFFYMDEPFIQGVKGDTCEN
nr:hypothetical protein BACY1_18300 [Tenacibaculum mesophilum]